MNVIFNFFKSIIPNYINNIDLFEESYLFTKDKDMEIDIKNVYKELTSTKEVIIMQILTTLMPMDYFSKLTTKDKQMLKNSVESVVNVQFDQLIKRLTNISEQSKLEDK